MPSNKLHGVIPPLVTPLSGRDQLDIPGLEKLLEHVVGGGVHGIFILGTSGEATSLSPRLRRELIDRAIRQVNGRASVLVGVTDTCVSESIELARHAADAGATAVVLSTPYYLPPDQNEILVHACMLVAEQPLPVIIYNIPVLTKTAYEPETVLRLSEIPKIIGIKDSSGDLAYLRKILSIIKREDFGILVGMEGIIAEGVTLGADGGVPGGGNMAPRLYVELYEAAKRGDAERVKQLQQRVEIILQIYRLGPGLAPFVRGMKCALGCMGICSDRLADPFAGPTDEQRERVRELLVEAGAMTPCPSGRGPG